MERQASLPVATNSHLLADPTIQLHASPEDFARLAHAEEQHSPSRRQMKRIVKQMDDMRRKYEHSEKRYKQSVSYLVSMHDWATKITKKLREVEARCDNAENALASSQEEISRLQQMINNTHDTSGRVNNGHHHVKRTNASKQKKLRRKTRDGYFSSTNEESGCVSVNE
jgi:chromosome segregation ATPase